MLLCGREDTKIIEENWDVKFNEYPVAALAEQENYDDERSQAPRKSVGLVHPPH
jgi:hypothetical protein